MKHIGILLLLAFSLGSCSKFLEEYSRDQKYVQTPDDLSKLIVGEGFITNIGLSIYSQSTMGDLTSEVGIVAPWLHVMDDDNEAFVADFVATDQLTPLYMLSGFHYWKQNPTMDIRELSWEDNLWRKLYKRIGALNAIIFQADEMALNATPGNNEKLNQIRGEALFLRAYYYFYLQNIYGSPYRKSTAAADEGIPLKVSEKVEDVYFKRDNNEAVYQQITSDLEKAAQYLDNYNPTTKIRIGIAAVRLFQTRVYLYTEQYDKVLEASEPLQTMGYELVDLNQYTTGTSFTYRGSPETIFTMGTNVIPTVFMNDSLSAWSGNDNRVSAFKASDNLMNTFDADDLRRKAFFDRAAKSKAWIPAKYRTWRTFNDVNQQACIFSLRYTEAILNRAEAMAMMGADNEARTELQKLRAKRFQNATIDQIPQSNTELVNFIREERRRELCFEGHRWFDLRRYAANTKYPLPADFNITHPVYTYDAPSNTHTRTGNYVLRSLSQDAAAWQVPIPNYAIEFNRGALTNPIRPVRSIQP